MVATSEPLSDRSSAITLWDILFTVGFALIFSPMSYAVSPAVYRLWRIAVVVVALVAVLIRVVGAKITVHWAAFVAFTLSYYFVSKIINSSDGLFNQQVFYSAKVIGFVSLLDYGLEKHRTQCLRGFIFAGVVMCGVHYATFLRYRHLPLGMKSSQFDLVGELTKHPWFFLTHDNGSVFYFLPVLCAMWYQLVQFGKGKWLTLGFTALTLYMYWSLNTITAMLVATFATVLFFAIWRESGTGISRRLGYRLVLFAGIAFNLLVVLFHNSQLFVMVAQFFHKSMDMGRGYIWIRAFEAIRQNPLFGVGFESDAVSSMRLIINHCHNILVQVMYTGGIVTTFLFAVGLVSCDVPSKERGGLRSKGQAVLCATIFSLLVAATFDWYLYMPVMFYPFVMYYHSWRDIAVPPSLAAEVERGSE